MSSYLHGRSAHRERAIVFLAVSNKYGGADIPGRPGRQDGRAGVLAARPALVYGMMLPDPGQLRDVRGQMDDDDGHPKKERQVVQPAPGPVARVLDARDPPPALAAMAPSGSALIPQVIVRDHVIPTGRTSRGKDRMITYGDHAPVLYKLRQVTCG